MLQTYDCNREVAEIFEIMGKSFTHLLEVVTEKQFKTAQHEIAGQALSGPLNPIFTGPKSVTSTRAFMPNTLIHAASGGDVLLSM